MEADFLVLIFIILFLVISFSTIIIVLKLMRRTTHISDDISEESIRQKEFELGQEKYIAYLNKIDSSLVNIVISRAEHGEKKDEKLHALINFIQKEKRRMKGE